MKLKLWCLFLGMGLVFSIVCERAIDAHAENYSLIEIAQANNSEVQDVSKEAEIEKANQLYQQSKGSQQPSSTLRITRKIW